jgi:hypothetical protein
MSVMIQFSIGSSSAIVGSHYKVDIGLQLNEPFVLSIEFANNTVTVTFHFFLNNDSNFILLQFLIDS